MDEGDASVPNPSFGLSRRAHPRHIGRVFRATVVLVVLAVLGFFVVRQDLLLRGWEAIGSAILVNLSAWAGPRDRGRGRVD